MVYPEPIPQGEPKWKQTAPLKGSYKIPHVSYTDIITYFSPEVNPRDPEKGNFCEKMFRCDLQYKRHPQTPLVPLNPNTLHICKTSLTSGREHNNTSHTN